MTEEECTEILEEYYIRQGMYRYIYIEGVKVRCLLGPNQGE